MIILIILSFSAKYSYPWQREAMCWNNKKTTAAYPQGLRDLKWVELFFLHQCTSGGPPYRVAFRRSSHGLQCEPSSGSPCGAQHWLCGSPCGSQCEPSRLSPCAGCLPPVSPYSRSPTSCMVKAFQGRLWFKVLVIGISSKGKLAF